MDAEIEESRRIKQRPSVPTGDLDMRSTTMQTRAWRCCNHGDVMTLAACLLPRSMGWPSTAAAAPSPRRAN